MTELSCKELTQMFLDKGGIFECNYEIKKCIVYPQNITCNIKNKKLSKGGSHHKKYTLHTKKNHMKSRRIKSIRKSLRRL